MQIEYVERLASLIRDYRTLGIIEQECRVYFNANTEKFIYFLTFEKHEKFTPAFLSMIQLMLNEVFKTATITSESNKVINGYELSNQLIFKIMF